MMRWSKCLRIAKELALRDLKTRYCGSAVGIYWYWIHPLVLVLVYTVVFQQVFKIPLRSIHSNTSYISFLCAALLPWISFQEMINRAPNLFLEYGGLIKKKVFPKEAIIIQSLITGTFQLVFSLIFFLLVSSIYGNELSSTSWGLPFIIFFQQIFTFGCITLLSVINLWFRDVAQLTVIVSSLGFWLTPILYEKENAPAFLQGILSVNPWTYLSALYRWTIQGGHFPDAALWRFLMTAVFFLVAGLWLFRKQEGKLVDLI